MLVLGYGSHNIQQLPRTFQLLLTICLQRMRLQEVQPTGTGTAADPFNVAGVEKYIDEGGSAETEVYVKGKVVLFMSRAVSMHLYGSLKYYISEDGTPTRQVLCLQWLCRS